MRNKGITFALFALTLWATVTYFLLFHDDDDEPTDINVNNGNIDEINHGNNGQPIKRKLSRRIDELESEISELINTNNKLIDDLQKNGIPKFNRSGIIIATTSTTTTTTINPKNNNNNNYNEIENKLIDSSVLWHNTSLTNAQADKLYELASRKYMNNGSPIIAILVISCNRETAVKRCLDRLINFRPNVEQFPIIVSQDCGHKPTSNVIKRYDNKIFHMQQPDTSDIDTPNKEKKFKGYFKIARHYGWALNQVFSNFGFQTTIVVEDDLDVSPDFYEYFLGTHSVLTSDPTLWCVSAWNDNGKADVVDLNSPHLLHRTDFFPGLGWMLTKKLWDELGPKWPKSYWDDWIRHPDQRKDRSCIRPEISRTRTFGEIGVSNGLFYKKHLQFIKLNDQFVPFTEMNLTHLLKENYDVTFVNEVYSAKKVTLGDLTANKITSAGPVRIQYFDRQSYKLTAKRLGLMDDFKSGVPRTGYRGVVTLFYKNLRVYLAPGPSWSGYDLTWS